LDFKLFNSDRCAHVGQRRRDTRGNTTLILPGLVIIEVTAVKSGAVRWVVEFSCAMRSAAWIADTCANSCRLDFGVHDPPTPVVVSLIEAEQHDFGQGFGCLQCYTRKFNPALDGQLAQLVAAARHERNAQELVARQAKTALAVARMHASRDQNLQAKRQKSEEAAAAARQRAHAMALGAAARAAQQGASESPAASPEPSSVKPECPGDDVDVDSGDSGDDDDQDAADDATMSAAVVAAARQAQIDQARIEKTQAAMARARNGGCPPAAVLNVLGGHF